MKIIKTILYGILVFFILCCGVIILCAVKPEMSAKIADTLKLNENEEYRLSPVPGNSSWQGDDTEDGQNTDVILSDEPNGEEEPDFGTPSSVPVSRMNELDTDDPQNTDLQIDPATYGIIVPPGVAGRAAISRYRMRAVR